MMHPLRRPILLVPMFLLASSAWLPGCRPSLPRPSGPSKQRTSVEAPARQARAPEASVEPPAFSEVTLRQGGVAVTSLTYDSRVFFDTDHDQPRPEAAPVLDALATRLKRQPGPPPHVAVLGHTDALGSDAYNLALSRRRAVAVVRALATRGIDPATLDPVAVGRRQPIAPDDSQAGRARNRRVEFLISASARAIEAVIASRPAGAPPKVRHPAALHLHVRQPDALTRAPLGDPIPY